jgi:hypothetical protein
VRRSIGLTALAAITFGTGLASGGVAVIIFRALPAMPNREDPVSAALITGGLVLFYVAPAGLLGPGLVACGIGCWRGSRRAVTGSAVVLALTALWASFVALAAWNHSNTFGNGSWAAAAVIVLLCVVGIVLALVPGTQPQRG